MWSEEPVAVVAANSSLLQWFCLRSHSKHEHIAARYISRVEGIEAFLPRIRFRRKRRQGPVWVTEALFPNYLFARFNWESQGRIVRHAPGVCDVVHFGNRWPAVPNGVMEELRAQFGDDSVYVIGNALAPGDEVQISGGAFHGLAGVITRVMPARERVAVLLDFLGRQTAVEIPTGSVIRQADARTLIP